jgi:hypothetical protein
LLPIDFRYLIKNHVFLIKTCNFSVNTFGGTFQITN